MMSKLSLLDKLKVLSDVTSSSGLFAVAILLFVVFFYLMITTNTKTKKVSKISCIAIYGSIIIVTLVFYREQLFSLFDYMMDNFFIAVYFPNLAIYFAAIVTTNIILLVSIFNRKVTKWIRTINTLVFCVIHYLLVLIINIITTNKLNIFEQTSIYENQNAQALIELSSSIFMIWILFLIVYKIIRSYQKSQAEQVEQPEKIIIKEPAPPVVKTETVIKRKIPDSIKMIDSPSMILGNIKKQEESFVQENNYRKPESIEKKQNTASANDNSYLFDIPDPILTPEPQFLDVMLKNQQQEQTKQTPVKEERKAPSKKRSKELDILDGLLTLDDYKRVLSILKTYQSKQHQNTTQKSTQEEPRKVENLSQLYQRR